MLTILNNTIRMLDGLYSLNDLHKASGGENRHAPFRFMRLEHTKALINELERSPDMVNGIKSISYKTIQGGEPQKQGTYVCYDLAITYAMWVSPRFQILVIRAFKTLTNYQYQLNHQLNELCHDIDLMTSTLSSAGRVLCVGGKQIKPQMIKARDSLLRQMQPCLPFGSEFEPVGGNHD